MTFISYAQNFEDVLLNRVFKHKVKGFYIDVGALHPTFDSVTKAFYDMGWSGINIEPIKEYYNIFQEERSRDINLNIAISNSEEDLEFFQLIGQPGNSTLNKEIAYTIAQEKGLDISKYTVPVKTLAQVCKEYVNQKIDFLKIDVEGLEEQVILGGDWEIFRPTILVIESTLLNTNIRCKNNISGFLQEKGYQQVFFDGINDYYISEESCDLAEYFSFPVNILDNYIDYRLIEKQRAEHIKQIRLQYNTNTPFESLIISNVAVKNTIINEPLHKQHYLSVINSTEQIKSHLSREKAKILTPHNILIDGVFFQLHTTGIARVWRSLLEQWSTSDFANRILVLDRANTAPKINGISYLTIPAYDYKNTEADKQMLQKICDDEGADLFISSYYTTPTATPSVFMAYDMIPEVMRWDMNSPMWREKHRAIQQASAYIAISENTARDLKTYFTDIPLENVTVAHCGVKNTFSPAKVEYVNIFRYRHGITKPYFLLVGIDGGNKNSILFFQAFAKLANSYGFEIVCTGSRGILPAGLRAYTLGSAVHMLQLSDEELAIAYSGAVALVYPSKYEGFGMPIIEAMACGCPVITCPNASIPEVAGEAAIYVKDDDVDALANALCEVQKPSVRQSLITAGLAQSQKFSWLKMADIVSSTLLDVSKKTTVLTNRN